MVATGPAFISRSQVQHQTRGLGCEADLMDHWPLASVWLGTSVESGPGTWPMGLAWARDLVGRWNDRDPRVRQAALRGVGAKSWR